MMRQGQGTARIVLAAIVIVLFVAVVLIASSQFGFSDSIFSNSGAGFFSLAAVNSNSAASLLGSAQSELVAYPSPNNSFRGDENGSPNIVKSVDDSNSSGNGLAIVDNPLPVSHSGSGAGSSSSGVSSPPANPPANSDSNSPLSSNSPPFSSSESPRGPVPTAGPIVKTPALIGVESFPQYKLSIGDAAALSGVAGQAGHKLRTKATVNSASSNIDVNLVSYGIVLGSHLDNNTGVVWHKLAFYNVSNPTKLIGSAWADQNDLVSYVGVSSAITGPAPKIVSPAGSGGINIMSINYYGTPNALYTIQSRDSFSSPWVNRAEYMSDANGHFLYVDNNVSSAGMRFYQAIITRRTFPENGYDSHFKLYSPGSGYVVGEEFTASAGGALLEDVSLRVLGVDLNGGITSFVVYSDENKVLSKTIPGDSNNLFSLSPKSVSLSGASNKNLSNTINSNKVASAYFSSAQNNSVKRISFESEDWNWGSDCSVEDGETVCWPTPEEYLAENYHGCWVQINDVSHPEIPKGGSIFSIGISAELFGPDCNNSSARVTFTNLQRVLSVTPDSSGNNNPPTVVDDVDFVGPFPANSVGGFTIVVTNFYQRDTYFEDKSENGAGWWAITPDQSIKQGAIKLDVISATGQYTPSDTWNTLVGMPLDEKVEAIGVAEVMGATNRHDLEIAYVDAEQRSIYIGCMDDNSESNPIVLEAGQFVLPNRFPEFDEPSVAYKNNARNPFARPVLV
jgi:hypothetical protein